MIKKSFLRHHALCAVHPPFTKKVKANISSLWILYVVVQLVPPWRMTLLAHRSCQRHFVCMLTIKARTAVMLAYIARMKELKRALVYLRWRSKCATYLLPTVRLWATARGVSSKAECAGLKGLTVLGLMKAMTTIRESKERVGVLMRSICPFQQLRG